MTALSLGLALLLDLLLGDPAWLPHPVKGMGRAITFLEGLARKVAKNPARELVAGALLVALVMGGSFALAALALRLAYGWGRLPGDLLAGLLLFTTLATRSLGQEAEKVRQPLVQGRLEEARLALSGIVGRDTGTMGDEEIVRATVETVAENTVDGALAPLFYALLGGAPLAMAYRAANTLDSMLGYKNSRYLYFGRAAARLDDLLNLLPARLAGLLLAAAAWLQRLDAAGALRCALRDARKHPSPNSGYPEAAVAGALGLRLGGLNFYHGQPSFRPHLGVAKRQLSPERIREAVRLMYLSSALLALPALAWLVWRAL